MSTTTSNTPVKFIGLITLIAGILMIVAGGVTWGLVTSQLTAEHITVAPVTPQAPGSLAGKPVAGPFTAYAQADAIRYHSLAGADGRTYAQLGTDAKTLKAKLAASGVAEAAIATDPGVVKLADQRTQTMNGSFLRASLFASVISFGVSALVIGVGFLFTILGFALTKVATIKTVTTSAGAKTGSLVGASA